MEMDEKKAASEQVQSGKRQAEQLSKRQPDEATPRPEYGRLRRAVPVASQKVQSPEGAQVQSTERGRGAHHGPRWDHRPCPERGKAMRSVGVYPSGAHGGRVSKQQHDYDKLNLDGGRWRISYHQK